MQRPPASLSGVSIFVATDAASASITAMANAAIVITVLAVAAAVAFAGDPPKDTLRDDIAALVAWVPRPGDGDRFRAPPGPSPTALTARIVAKGDAKIRPELGRLWRLAGAEGTPAEGSRRAIEETIRFLYGTGAPDEPQFRVMEGAVLSFPSPKSDYDFGSLDRAEKAGRDIPVFELLVKGGKLRTAPKPVATTLVEALQKTDVAGWGTAAREALARTAGERCAGPMAAKLVALAQQQPTDPTLSTALAWSSAPEAEAELRSRVTSLAARVAGGKDAARPLLGTAVAGLHHVKPDALREVFDALPHDARCAAVAAAGTDLALGYALDRAEKAGDDDRAASFELVRSAIGDGGGGDGDGDGERDAGARLIAYLKRMSGDPDLGAAALQSAETLLYAFNRYPVHDSSNMNGIETTNDGAQIGPYPGIGVVLELLAADLATGAAVFHRPAESLWDEPVVRLAGYGAAKSALRSPDPNAYHDDSAKPPVSLAGVVTPKGLELTLTNCSSGPLALNTASLGWGCGQIVKTTHQADGGKATSYTSLRLQLGFVRASIAVPAEKLRVLAAGASHTWTVQLRDEDRAVDHVCVEVLNVVGVIGKPAAPLFPGFDDTWVK